MRDFLVKHSGKIVSGIFWALLLIGVHFAGYWGGYRAGQERGAAKMRCVIMGVIDRTGRAQGVDMGAPVKGCSAEDGQ